jgi:hypothetical protein
MISHETGEREWDCVYGKRNIFVHIRDSDILQPLPNHKLLGTLRAVYSYPILSGVHVVHFLHLPDFTYLISCEYSVRVPRKNDVRIVLPHITLFVGDHVYVAQSLVFCVIVFTTTIALPFLQLL